nr:hypothetical protein [Tanacetum cinerariifolium]
MCELACQLVQKNLEEKQLEEAQTVKAQSWKFPICYDDDDDEEGCNSLNDNIISELPPYSAVTPTEPIDSLSMGDKHLNTILATKSDEFINSCVENLVPNPSESEGESGCDVPAGFTTFSNVLFDDDYDSDSSDDQSLYVEDVREKIYSNPLFDEEIIPMEIDPHSFNAESDPIEPLPNHDSSVNISSKIDSLFDEFAGELTLLKSFPPGIDETDCHPEKEIRLTKRLFMRDEHLDTIPAMESDEFIKSCVENLVSNPSESNGENGCDVPAGFTTFSNVLFDDDYDSDSSDDQSLSVEDVREKIYLNPLFEEEIIPMEIDQHFLNAESDLIESLPNHDSSVIISSKIDSLFDEFADELTLDDDYDSERDIPILEELLDSYSLSLPTNESYHFDISSPYRPPAKPPDGNTGTLNIKIMGDVFDQKIRNKQEKDKIGTKPDKNEKRGKAGKSQE